jgi:hypothetical protein
MAVYHTNQIPSGGVHQFASDKRSYERISAQAKAETEMTVQVALSTLGNSHVLVY